MRVGPWVEDRRTTLVLDLATLLAVALVYAVVVLGGGMAIGATQSPSIGLSVLATVLVALGLDPFRAVLRPILAERLGHGRRAPYDVLSGFTDSLGDVGAEPGAAPGDLPLRLARHLADGTGASWAQVWLMVNGRLEPAATWPPHAAPGLLGASAPGVHERAVVLEGDHLGTLRVKAPEGTPFGTMEQRLLADLAAQAGMVLYRVRLRAELARRASELAARADELQESRRRVVDAHDAERRRLERDIHDGAQQHLVALVVNLRLAQALAGRAPDRAKAVLAEQVSAVDEAIATLGDLSRGIYPQALVREGVGAALRGVVSATTVPIEVHDHGVGRLPEEIEAALYFCAVEAVQNAVKHAGASSIRITVSAHGGEVRLEVTDDGVGFEPGSGPTGHGLGNMRDRIDAAGGRLTLHSRPEAGVRVVATLPIPLDVAS